jgi:DNA-binding response OmpR family regulator
MKRSVKAQKILIVEDNADLSQLLAFYLSNAGYETSRAGNSAEGISKALAERPNLIITDLYLPDMNAVDATVSCYVRHSHCCTYRHDIWRMEN